MVPRVNIQMTRSARIACTFTRSRYLFVPLDPVPVDKQLAAILRARIERNEFPHRQPLPSQSQLMGQYGVSLGSVRHALQVLAEEGLTVTIQGRGTYVLPLEDG
jgi:GntR family transcriptional regulator